MLAPTTCDLMTGFACGYNRRRQKNHSNYGWELEVNSWFRATFMQSSQTCNEFSGKINTTVSCHNGYDLNPHWGMHSDVTTATRVTRPLACSGRFKAEVSADRAVLSGDRWWEAAENYFLWESICSLFCQPSQPSWVPEWFFPTRAKCPAKLCGFWWVLTTRNENRAKTWRD